MSKQAIDYVNSLEVKEPLFADKELFFKSISNNIPSIIEQERIRKQARKAWICIAVIILVVVITNWR